MVSKALTCNECGHDIPLGLERCPHCGRPGLFSNVLAAQDTEESTALEHRYQEAKNRAEGRGTQKVIEDFENQVLNSSCAVIARSILEVHRLSTSSKELYASYYEILEAPLRLPDGDKWDVLRRVTDDALFPGYRKRIKFAALSLDGIGLTNYGECSIALRSDMIAHRASVFEENSATFMKNKNIKLAEAHDLPRGFRATWAEREKLCIAKVVDLLTPTTGAQEYPEILMHQGASSEHDRFVEVHIWGPITINSVEHITITARPKRGGIAILKAVQEQLGEAMISVRTQ